MPEVHARLGPSNHRWPNCPGSVREEAQYPDIPGDAAIDGTGTHLLLEQCLKNAVGPEAYLGHNLGLGHHDKPTGWVIDQDRADRVQMCLNYIRRRHGELTEQFPDSTITVEAESVADPGGMAGRDDWWGTCDVTITVTFEGRCLFVEVVDYKDGRGWVAPKGNTQLISYLLGKMRPFIASGPQKVRPFRPELVYGCRVTIVQPKTSPPIRYEDVSPHDMVVEFERLEKAAFATDDPEAPLIPDDKNGKGYCQWCKHKPNCSARNEQSLNTVKAMGTDVVATDGQSLFELVGQSIEKVETLSNDELAKLADAEPGMQEIFERVRKEIEKRIDGGDDFSAQGYAKAPGNKSKEWAKSEEEIAKMLRARKLKKDEIYPAKLITPAQVLKLPQLNEQQKEKILKDYITEKPGKLTLKRVGKAEKETPEMMFGDVAQSQTSVVKSPTPSMFADTDEVSFF